MPDAEPLAPGREADVKAIYEQFGWDGVIAWCAVTRNTEPMERLRTEKYKQARAAIEAAKNN